MANGNGHSDAWKWLTGGGSVLAVVMGFSLTTAKDAKIALEVAAQHGQEMLEIRAEIKGIRDELFARTRERYTASDADKDMKAIFYRIGEVEKDLEKATQFISDHHRLSATASVVLLLAWPLFFHCAWRHTRISQLTPRLRRRTKRSRPSIPNWRTTQKPWKKHWSMP
jgi:hypothetical protein